MTGVTFWRGVAIASLAAGPLFCVAMYANAEPGSAAMQVDNAWFGIAVLAVPFGAVIAGLPNLLGAAALGALGRGNIGVRLPVFWALVGAGCGWGLDAAIAAIGPGAAFTPIFAWVAPACALLCRAGTRWTDEKVVV